MDLKKLFRGEHPFISEPAVWIVAGHGLSGEPLTRAPVHGRLHIIHRVGKVVIHGERAQIYRASGSASFPAIYEMTPTEDDLMLAFFQPNEAVGHLSGKVIAFDDRLISSYTSGDGTLTGVEVFLKMGENRYAVTGSLLSAGKVLNLWKLDLVRPSSDASVSE